MPLIIPPVKNKSYNKFGNLFKIIWGKAEESLIKADRIYLIGYSFPKTDIQSNELFLSAFCKRKIMPDIIIINPFPDYIYHKFKNEYGIKKEKIRIFKEYINKDYKIENL
jgi:hypothetical protein